MAYQFSIIGLSSITGTDPISGSSSDNTDTVGSSVGDVLSFSSWGDARGYTADGDYPDDTGATLTAPLTINGTTYPAGSEIEADWEIITVDPDTGYYFRITGLYVNEQPVGVTVSRAWDASTGEYVQGKAGAYVPGTNLTHIDGDDLDGTPNIANFATDSNYSTYGTQEGIGNDATLTANNGTPICLADGAMVETDGGAVAVEDLSVGMRVRTLDAGLCAIAWIGRRRLDALALDVRPEWRPLRIRAGALGAGMPARDLVVSPQHRVLVRSAIARRMFGTGEVLVAARHLLALPGIEPMTPETVRYHHVWLGHHQILIVNGTPVESFWPGPVGLGGLSRPARAELIEVSPNLPGGKPARPLVQGRRARTLVARHIANGQPLLSKRTSAGVR